MKEKRILTYGLSHSENNAISSVLPSRDYELFHTEAATDLIALNAVLIVINASALADDDRNMLFDFFTEAGGCTDETVIWLGAPTPPKALQKNIKCYGCFAEIEAGIKYLLLDAHRRCKKSSEFSSAVMHALKILAAIREKPGITSRELAQRCGLSTRSVQRYVEALRCSGEWIDYDPACRGWKLFHSTSSLIASFFGEELDK